jgi:hypothetical protein
MILFCAGASGSLAAKRPSKVAMRVMSAGEEAVRSYDFVLEADQPFPVRALDPVLNVGGVELLNYKHAGPNTLVFAGDPANLKQGASVFLQYGNDEESRWDLGYYRGLTDRRK